MKHICNNLECVSDLNLELLVNMSSEVREPSEHYCSLVDDISVILLQANIENSGDSAYGTLLTLTFSRRLEFSRARYLWQLSHHPVCYMNTFRNDNGGYLR